jgi:hypothetical protein
VKLRCIISLVSEATETVDGDAVGTTVAVGTAVAVGTIDGTAVALTSGATVVVIVGLYEACGIESWLPVALENDRHPLTVAASARMQKIANAFVFIVRLTSLSFSQPPIKCFCTFVSVIIY